MMLHARLAKVSRETLVHFSNTRRTIPTTTVSAIGRQLGASRRPLAPLVTLAGRRGFSTGSSSKSKSSSDSFFKRAWTKYLVLLETRPLATKIVTGGAIAGIGDINCQLFLEHGKPFDAKRTAVFTFLGGVFISPILHVWYGFLGRVVPGTTSLAIAKRLALDQLVFAPSFLPVFFTTLLTLEGDVGKVPEKLRQEWWPAVKANWVVWVPAQLLNFRFVPGSLQVLFSNVVGLFWNSYMSYISHTEAHKAVVEPVAVPAADSAAAVTPLLASG